MATVVQRLLRSNLAWRLSGLTLPTAILATSGRVRTVSDYLDLTRRQMKLLSSQVEFKGHVLEFGSGLGGNLIAIRDRLIDGIGLDINRSFLSHARALARIAGASNLQFVEFDGHVFPFPERSFDCIFSIGVFERLPRSRVRQYVTSFSGLLKPGGVCALYFLSDIAMATTFSNLLGRDAYVTWRPDEVTGLVKGTAFSIIESFPWGAARRVGSSERASIAQVYVLRRTDN